MSRATYAWRQLTSEQREAILTWRKTNRRPWHGPPHRPNNGHLTFHVTAACFEHRPHIGWSPERIDAFAGSLLELLSAGPNRVACWCVLPNHYHALVETPDILALLRQIGRLHGRTSYAWNGEENSRGRQVFHRVVERAMRSDAHMHATINYVHHNPVRHGYVAQWTEWPWSSANDFLAAEGREEAARRWREYPVLDYGKGWDDPEL